MKTKEFKIMWRHESNKGTSCLIRNYKDAIIGCGLTCCSISDNFCRETGRKLSLARAMKNASLGKEERTEIWEAYRTMGNKKRW
jgi:hypothetical protein